MFFKRKPMTVVGRDEALPGRSNAIPVPEGHFFSGKPMTPPYPDGMDVIDIGMGCFWGVERLFWQAKGVYVTAAGYAGGHTPNPTYEEVCSGMTGHTEVVRVVFDPEVLSVEGVLKLFWENHDPTQGMRQGNDVGTQYRSAIYCHTPQQLDAAYATAAAFQERLQSAGFGAISTEISEAPDFYFAEDYHQQYLAKNPGGYCALAGVGVTCPVGILQNAAS